MRTNYINCCDNIVGLRGLPDNCIDLTVTSPPYDNLRDYNGFAWDADGLIRELYRVTKPGGVVVWVVNDATVKGSETGTSFRQALAFMDAGFNLHDTMIYEKANPVPLKSKRYTPAFEYMFVFSKGAPKTFNPIKEKCKHAGKKAARTIIAKNGSRQHYHAGVYKEEKIKINIFTYTVGTGRGRGVNHPAVFPEQLAHDHIISWSRQGDVVLDPFMGSGTTALACIRNGRKYIGFEISEQYCQIAQQRVQEATQQQAEEGAWMQ